jgi:hypothetical protein
VCVAHAPPVSPNLTVTEPSVWPLSGVSPDRYPLLTVTLEDEDNDQSSSGRLVLSGAVED